MGNSFLQNCKKKTVQPKRFQSYTKKIHLSNDPICLLNSHGLFQDMNKQFLSFLKITNEAIILGKSIYTLFPPVQDTSNQPSPKVLQQILSDIKKSEHLRKVFYWTFLNTEGQTIKVQIWVVIIQSSSNYYFQLVLQSCTGKVCVMRETRTGKKENNKEQNWKENSMIYIKKNDSSLNQALKIKNIKHKLEPKKSNQRTKQRVSISEIFPTSYTIFKKTPLFFSKLEPKEIRKRPQSSKEHVLLFPISCTNLNMKKTFLVNDKQYLDGKGQKIDKNVIDQLSIFKEPKENKSKDKHKDQEEQEFDYKTQNTFHLKTNVTKKIQPFEEKEEKHRFLSEHIYEIKSLIHRLENSDIEFEILNLLNDISNLFDQKYSKIAWKIQLLLIQHQLNPKEPHNSLRRNTDKEKKYPTTKQIERKEKQEKNFGKKYSFEEESKQILLL
ncbi:hypothetical protein M0812_04086 [Anaeramoeba flamelloides]|uniref:Uncharacterized protein n=1 Tax=Anaeramoeba flamelloides TaxID=1746091 RepID=A0AAV8AH54_9EUKA|nr:hypothetical protein M0812_04086 [Anaeramoeba flamelloides]